MGAKAWINKSNTSRVACREVHTARLSIRGYAGWENMLIQGADTAAKPMESVCILYLLLANYLFFGRSLLEKMDKAELRRETNKSRHGHS